MRERVSVCVIRVSLLVFMVFATSEWSVQSHSDLKRDQTRNLPVASGEDWGFEPPPKVCVPPPNICNVFHNFASNSSLHNLLDVFFQAGNAPKPFSAFVRGSPLGKLMTPPHALVGYVGDIPSILPPPPHLQRLASLLGPLQIPGYVNAAWDRALH